VLLATPALDAGVFARAGVRAGEFAEVRIEQTRVLSLVWRGARAESASDAYEEGGGVRVVGPGGWSFVSFTGADAVAALRGARDQARLLRAGRVQLAAAEPVRASHQLTAPDSAAEVDLAEKAAVIGGYHARIRAAHPRVSGSLVFYREARTRVSVINTSGTRVERAHADLILQITVFAQGPSGTATGSVSIGSGGSFATFRDLDAAVEDACHAAIDTAAAPALAPGAYDVVCDGPLAGAWAHETIGHLAEADHQLGDPRLRDVLRPGRRIGPEILTVVDHGGTPGCRGRLPVDDEGVPARPIPLIAEGRVGGLVHSRMSAGAFAEAPTGNARAVGFRFPPLPRLRTTQIEPGPHRLADMIGRTERGLLACGFSGGQTDRLGFAFTPASCRLIEDGQPGRYVPGVLLSGDIIGAFGKIDMVGDQLWRGDTSASCGKLGQWPLPVSSWAPAIRLHGIHVGAHAGAR
jgi:TldD protein